MTRCRPSLSRPGDAATRSSDRALTALPPTFRQRRMALTALPRTFRQRRMALTALPLFARRGSFPPPFLPGPPVRIGGAWPRRWMGGSLGWGGHRRPSGLNCVSLQWDGSRGCPRRAGGAKCAVLAVTRIRPPAGRPRFASSRSGRAPAGPSTGHSLARPYTVNVA